MVLFQRMLTNANKKWFRKYCHVNYIICDHISRGDRRVHEPNRHIIFRYKIIIVKVIADKALKFIYIYENSRNM